MGCILTGSPELADIQAVGKLKLKERVTLETLLKPFEKYPLCSVHEGVSLPRTLRSEKKDRCVVRGKSACGCGWSRQYAWQYRSQRFWAGRCLP